MTDFEYRVIRSERLSIKLSMHPDGTVLILCPDIVVDEYIEELVHKKANKIREFIAKHKILAERTVLTSSDVTRLKVEAKKDLPGRIDRIGAVMGVMPDAVQITSANKQWACCIRRWSHHKLCFSYRVLLPEELRDFVVKHELAHITEIRHTPAFFVLLGKYEPNHEYIADQIKRQEAIIPYYAKNR